MFTESHPHDRPCAGHCSYVIANRITVCQVESSGSGFQLPAFQFGFTTASCVALDKLLPLPVPCFPPLCNGGNESTHLIGLNEIILRSSSIYALVHSKHYTHEKPLSSSFFFVCFIGEEMEAQRGGVTCPNSQLVSGIVKI